MNLLEERLEYLSKSNTYFLEYYYKWKEIKIEISKKLNNVAVHFSHYSRHDVSHSEKIANYISNILGKDRIEKLSFSDILLMLMSYYYHDIGMVISYRTIYDWIVSDKFESDLKEIRGKNTDKEIRMMVERVLSRYKEYLSNKDNKYIELMYEDLLALVEIHFRSKHAVSSYEYIIKDDTKQIEGCIGKRMQHILADVCASHGEDISNIMSKYPERVENGIANEYIHPRFVAACLCLGDLLDIDVDRFDLYRLAVTTPLPNLSLLHKEKHESIMHYYVNKNEIKIYCNTDTIEVCRIVYQDIQYIKKTCSFLAEYWSEIAPSDFGTSPRLKKCDIKLNGKRISFYQINAKYEITPQRFIQLYAGKNIYNNKFSCIREIIQNAIDSTIIRLYEEGKINKNNSLEEISSMSLIPYKITGLIKKNDEGKVCIKIRDYGTGIRKNDFNRIIKMARTLSVREKRLFSEMQEFIKPSGAFGLGLQSIFLLTDSFKIRTRTPESFKSMTFHSPECGGYVDVNDVDIESNTFQQGSEIYFEIDNNKIEHYDLINCPGYIEKEYYPYFIIRTISAYYGTNKKRKNGRILNKCYDYIPVNIEIDNDNEKEYIHYNSGLIKEKNKIKNGKFHIIKFVDKTNCMIRAELQIQENESHAYGKFVPDYEGSHQIFYRYNPVNFNLFNFPIYTTNLGLLSFFAWRINILSDSADNVLTIDRKNILQVYYPIFISKLLFSVKNITKDIIDYSLNDVEDINVVGDLSLLIYQFAREIKYKEEVVLKKYNNILNKISIEYHLQDEENVNNIEYEFNQLQQKKIYFYCGKIDCHVELGLSENQNINQENILCPKLAETANVNETNFLINHSLCRIFAIKQAKEEKSYCVIAEAEPFEIYNPMEDAVRLDPIILRNYLLEMIKYNFIGIPAIKGYEKISMPYIDPNDVIFSSLQPTVIIPIIGSHQLSEYIKNIFEKNKYIPTKMVKNIKKSLMNDESIHPLIKQIRLYHEISDCKFYELYENMIDNVLRILQDETYINYNRDYYNKIDDKCIYNSRNGIRMCPDYITFSPIVIK